MSKNKRVKRNMEELNSPIPGVNEIYNYFAFKKRKIPFINLHECTERLYCDHAISGEDKTVTFIKEVDSYMAFNKKKEPYTNLFECIADLYTKSAIEKIDEQILGKEQKLNLDRKISIDKSCEALINFSNSLNELKKQKSMKITEDTKIKDLIPEGYEFNPEFSMEYFKSSCNVTIPVKKKEVKDFKWYVKKYFERYNKYLNTTKDEFPVNENFIEKENYKYVPFEIRIGLLKFICDDMECDWKLFIDIKESKPEFTKVCAICPSEFLNSIFK